MAWTDARNSPTGSNDDIFLQRVTASGAIAPGWPADGVAVCLAPGFQGPGAIAADELGGVVVAWLDLRNAASGTGSDIYAQRILADGTIAPGWPVNGVAVIRAPADQRRPVVLADGNGGAFITWYEDSPQADAYLQHLAPDGTVAPGWPPGGLPVCTAQGLQAAGGLAPDGVGGALIAWQDFRDGSPAVYAHRASGSGQLQSGWPENGFLIVGNRYLRELLPDGTGGAYLSCATLRGFGDGEYYVQRFTSTGVIATGWPDGGAPVCIAPDERAGLRMEPDGTGGVLLVWSDYRDGIDSDVYVLRMRSDGTRDPSWPFNGLPATDNALADDIVDLASDGQGGAYLTWVQSLFAPQVMIQHLTGSGTVAPGWPAGGRVIPSQVGSPHPRIAPDGMGGAIVTWEDYSQRARALRIAPDGPVAVQVSLVSAEAEPNRVRLTWFADDAASLVAVVERRTESGDWERLGLVIADGSGRLTYEDRAVIPGTRYGYRLAYRDQGEERVSAETWVTVPALAFALHGPEPNPILGDLVVAFSLGSGAPARLEVFDLAGRQVLAREVGSLGVGRHGVTLAPTGRLAAGVFTMRLTQGERRATARAVVLR